METKLWPYKLQQSVQTTVTNMDNGNNLLDNTNTLQDNTNNNEEKCNKNVRLEQDVQAVISEKGRQKIQSILELVNTLEPIEKLMLYLKLPTETSDTVDPLRQSLNPLGSRTEINQTIMWIQTHLEEDKELSLQKKGVYDDYVAFCQPNGIKPLSTADFGKVMKQVYPNVRPRRLGTRGKSKYCYSGLRSRIKLAAPQLPDLGEKPLSTEANCTQSDFIAAAWIIIKEWAEQKFTVQFKSLTSLAYHLVKEYSVGVGSEAAILVSNSNTQIKDEPVSSHGYLSRHKETTLQLQRKLQQKNDCNKETKRKSQLQSPKLEQKSSASTARCKRAKLSSASTSCSTSPVAASEYKSSPQSQEHSPICDSTNLQALPDFNCFQRPPNSTDALLKDSAATQQVLGEYVGKVPIPRITNPKQSPVLSPKRAKNNNKYKAIQPKPETCDRASYNPKQTLTARDLRSQQAGKRTHPKKKDSPMAIITSEESNSLFTRERLISIGQVSKDALDEYLGTSNSQEQEEEIMQYFGNNNEDPDQEKLSQLRQLLEKNRIAQSEHEANVPNATAINSSPIVKTNFKAAHKSIIPPNLQNLNAKRRVSFDTHVHEETVPASPNTRRQNINFIPISPLSPNGRQSKCSSTNASPFVSPRNTPVPRARGNSHTYATNTINVRQARLQVKVKPDKIKKPDLEINIPTEEDKDCFKTQLTNLPMSAPPSPKTNYVFSKNYPTFQPQVHNVFSDPLSPEVSQLFTNNIPPSNLENAFRSQSVPLHNQFFNQFSFGNDQTPISNEFNDIEFNNEGLNVNKIIDDINIDQPNLDLLNLNELNENFPIESTNLRTIIRSQSIDVVEGTDYSGLKFPSRSVPSTPVPYNANIETEPFKSFVNQNSKSYPSTPLTSDTFSYNPGQDYLLNGQPIKDKVDFIGDGKRDLFYNDNDLIDNKNNFNFEGPMAEGSFGAKQNISAVLNEGDDDFFKVVPE